jgi:hypothetical protein
VLSKMVVSGGHREKVGLCIPGCRWCCPMVYPIIHRCLPFASFLSICPTTAVKGLKDGLLSLEGGGQGKTDMKKKPRNACQ